MKITFEKPYTYPVLAEDRNDYENCFFEVQRTFEKSATALKLNFEFETDCAEIKKLIAEGKAEYLVHLESPSTFFRTAIKSVAPESSMQIELNKVRNFLETVAFIVATKDVENFFCTDWNEDFEGLKFNLTKGNVLAYKSLPTIKLPENIDTFANDESIFTVCKKIGDDSSPFEIKLEENKVKILLSSKEFNAFNRYNKKTDLQPILNSMIILPTLVYIFDELRTEDGLELYGETDWFLSLTSAYKKRGIEFVREIIDGEKNSLELAQEIMELPITKALENFSDIYEESGDD